MVDDSTLNINFLPLSLQEFTFSIFASAVTNSAIPKAENTKRCKLPHDENGQEYQLYDIAFEQFPNSILRNISSTSNNKVTIWYIQNLFFKELQNKISSDSYRINTGFRYQAELVLHKHPEGEEIIWLEPYYLREKKLYGFLIGFRFRKASNIPFNRKIQQLSLSLSLNGQKNLNFYNDYYEKLTEFKHLLYGKIFPITLENGNSLGVQNQFIELKTLRLKSKKFVLADDHTANSTFQGIKDFGPYKKIISPKKLCFFYKEEDKSYAHDLYFALRGDRFATFAGMEPMFGFPVQKSTVIGKSVSEYTCEAIQKATEEVLETEKDIFPIIIAPWSKFDEADISDRNYYYLKHFFLTKKLPSQFISLNQLKNHEQLKWSISNIGLAIFSKQGGVPWRLMPEMKKCLIVGIGQAHQEKDGKIEKFFSYSVLSDSSGLYENITVLAKGSNEENYLHMLAESLGKTIDNYITQYESFVIHTPFRMRYRELDAVSEVLSKYISKSKVACLRFDSSSKYFSFNFHHNSKVPIEGALCPLSERDFLMSIEGLLPSNPIIRSWIAHPMHIELIYPRKVSDIAQEDKIGYLQDVFNLSGANWRGFKAKSLPISIYYSRLIANYIQCFNSLGLSEIELEGLPPWFL